MELLPRYLNEISDGARNKRLAAYEKLSQLCEQGSLNNTEEFDMLRACLRGFEDASERCREHSVKIVTRVLPRQNSSVLDWVLPAIVTRIGVSPVVEESEELRLLLLRLAVLCMETYPNEIGPRNYIDFFQVLLENCLRDAFPELKKEACRACVRLCEIEPVESKHIALPLATVVKCYLLHKHSVVRVEAVRALTSLIHHGAAQILSDGKEEEASRTTASILFVLANDHAESVRVALVELLSTVFLDIMERLEQHRKYLPHLLLLMTDRFVAVSTKACTLLERMGKLYMVDNEDNSIDITKRRVTMKDIEWYGDDDYPDMKLTTVDTNLYPLLKVRPTLGARYVVAESLRGFIEKILADVTAIDWVIKFSSNNRRVVALRILWMAIYHTEKSVVQFVEQILGVLYKSLRDDNHDVVQESLLCLEILGKFLTPEQYMPFLTGKGNPREAEEDITVFVQSQFKTILVSPANGSPPPAPTVFSTAAMSVKCSILVAFRYLIEGSKGLLSASQSNQIVQVMTSPDLLDSDCEALLCSLLDTLGTVMRVLGERGFVPTAANPLPREVAEDMTQRTLDSIMFYALLRLRKSDFPSVRERVSRCINDLSSVVTGDADGIYDLHFGRLLFRYGVHMPVSAFSDLVLHCKHIESYAEQVSDVFLVKLNNVDFTKRIMEELHYLRALEQLLWERPPFFTGTQLEELLRLIILPLGAFHPGRQAHLLRKVALGCLCAVVEEKHRCLLTTSFSDNEFALSSKAVTVWCTASDADDAEMRLLCMESAANVCFLPMNAGSANDIFQSILLRFDDSSDFVRVRAASRLLDVLQKKDHVCPIVIDQIIAQVVPLVKKVLIHLDDSEETVGLREVLVDVLKCTAVLSPLTTADLVRAAQNKHQNPTYCQNILCYIDSL
ncbi:HEAT repeat containing 2 [Trypanosoma conorhini]|uniref:HEAT repeat containing 2 n=1 Tax=Trypanosoma conorhini TaxID=83891 RepID=A0A3R7N464_9TRYP|nr:HEAT repeat containing 2 [Trypanosoma conorhini]RNF15805.1 HEAT repeat containing 2 [Trypanosoma conorhini]